MHPFGVLVLEHLHRKHGLSQSKLADGIDQPRTLIHLMCQGQRLTGSQARSRVLAVIRWLQQQQALATRGEANAILNAAGMAALDPALPEEAQILKKLLPDNTTAGKSVVKEVRADQPGPAKPDAGRATQNAAPPGRRRQTLPVHLTSFIGRERELEEVKQFLDSPATRILTLTGPGGAGKTRMALQLGIDLMKSYRDGVWWVELAAISDPARIHSTVAAALGIQERRNQMIAETLAEQLQYMDALLLLDNCEHLVDACAQFAEELLRACPNLQILATSREALGVEGEIAWSVPALTLPDKEKFSRPYLHRMPGRQNISLNEVDLATLMSYEAVRLFVERAQAALPMFSLNNDNATSLVEICNRLDGMPLAIELAAARVKVLTVDQIMERLDDCFRILAGGSRTALPRQQTLRATIDWSYNLLSVREKLLFQRLAVFAGGFTIEAAEKVCSDKELDERDILDTLANLLDKSLVQIGEQANEREVRYRMLETIRQYALDKLQESGDQFRVSDRHLTYYLELAEQTEPMLLGPEQAIWFDRIEQEHDNLRVALAWSLERAGRESAALIERHHSSDTMHNYDAAGLRMAGALGWFWFVRGYYREGRDWYERVLDGGGVVASLVRGKALVRASRLALWQSDIARGIEMAEVALKFYRESGDKQGIAEALANLGVAARMQANRAYAGELFNECLALSREIGYTRGTAESLGTLGAIAREQGEYTQATALLEESLALYRTTGEKWGIAWALGHLGVIAQAQGEYARATELCEESLALNREVGTKWSIANMTKTLGVLARLQGDYDRAWSLCEESVILAREAGEKSAIGSALNMLGIISLYQRDYRHAAACFQEGLHLCNEMGNRWGIAECFSGLAIVAHAESQLSRAAQLFGAAEALRAEIGTVLDAEDRREYERNVAAAREKLGEDAWATGWQQGQAMSLKDAVAFAADIPCVTEV